MGVQAQFGGTNQIISGAVVGPVLSNGGAITVTSTGIIRRHGRVERGE
jgi:hypothetical protein